MTNELKIEVGKKYVCRNGDIAHIIDISNNESIHYPVRARIGEMRVIFTRSGSYWCNDTSEFDLIKEYTEESPAHQSCSCPICVSEKIHTMAETYQKATVYGYDTSCKCDNCLIPKKTLRDEFAIAAFPLYLKRSFEEETLRLKDAAIASYEAADVMMKAKEGKL